MIDLTGEKIGKLTVLKESERRGGSRVWLCVCECGNTTEVRQGKLRGKETKSCGCLRNKDKITHGKTDSKEYYAWKNMLNRCNRPMTRGYKHYGGRGIKVCERWNDFNKFIKDMGDKPSNKHSIERKDTNGNYEPSNCLWADIKAQSRNKRTTRMVYYKGDNLPLITVCEREGVPYKRVWHRYMKQGLTLEQSLSKKLNFDGGLYSHKSV